LNRLDGKQINACRQNCLDGFQSTIIILLTHYHAGHGHILLGDLHPSSWRCAQIHQNTGLLQETKLSVELN
jgi:hypothetical protein